MSLKQVNGERSSPLNVTGMRVRLILKRSESPKIRIESSVMEGHKTFLDLFAGIGGFRLGMEQATV